MRLGVRAVAGNNAMVKKVARSGAMGWGRVLQRLIFRTRIRSREAAPLP